MVDVTPTPAARKGGTVAVDWPLLRRRSDEARERRQGGLGRIQAEPEVLVAVGGVQVGRLMPVRVPPRSDLGAALGLGQTDRRQEMRGAPRPGRGHAWSCE